MNTGNVVFRGGDGDDEIWANTVNDNADGVTYAKYYGGAGDDILKGALSAPTGQLLVGQGGRDTIDTAWLDGIKTDPPTTYGIDQTDLLIWGDYGYGTDGSFVVAEQYGDARLEEQIWGDDDIIRIGKGGGAETSSARVWAGDGDDEIDIASGWYGHEINAGRGDDTIIFNGSYSGSMGTTTLNGGLGDDIFRAGPDFADTNNDMNTITINGGEGKNTIEGFSGAATLNVNGGADDDVITVGDNVGTGTVMAGAGNDLVIGSGDADAMTPGTANLTVDLGDGDDIFEGGESGNEETVTGGLGND